MSTERDREDAMRDKWIAKGYRAREAGNVKLVKLCVDKAQYWQRRGDEESRDEDFRVTYGICTCRSKRIYGRRELRRYVIAKLRKSTWVWVAVDQAGMPLERLHAIVDLFIDDPQWMRRKTGCVVNSIFVDIEAALERDPRLLWGEGPPRRDPPYS
jgi:hypothetical protein